MDVDKDFGSYLFKKKKRPTFFKVQEVFRGKALIRKKQGSETWGTTQGGWGV